MKSVYTLLIGAVVLLTGCKDQTAPPRGGATEVGVVTLQTQAVPLQTELAGRTVASLTSDVRPQVTGIVRARKFNEGAEVRAGQVLYEIDPSSYQAAYDQASAEVTDAEATVTAARLKDQRYAELLQVEGVAKQDADDAHAAYQQAVAAVAQKKAALESARINLNYTQVRAPISGRIGKSSVTPGALVIANQSDALATIRTLDPIYVDLTQSSAALIKLRKMLGNGRLKSGSTTVNLKLEDNSEYAKKGILKFTEVAVDEATGSVTLRAQFPNPDGTLLPGMYVRAVLDQAVDPNAILAPQQGVTRDAKGNAVAMVVNKQNQVEQRIVVTERVVGDQWLVSDGLSPGDHLIVEGLNKIKPGDTVQVVEIAQDSKQSSKLAASSASTTASKVGG